MSDNGRWFKLWINSITDNRLAALPNELWAIWAKFGTYIKCHGREGEIELIKPEKTLCAILQCDDFDCLITALQCLPNVTVTLVTNTIVTYAIKYENWFKYQGDYSGDRVRKFRTKNVKNVTPKKRREEKRKEENIKEGKNTSSYQEIISDLNNIISTNYRSDPPNKEVKNLIDMRLLEGNTVDNFKKVHRNMYYHWHKDPKMKQFLRPQTLYTNKFEAYLNNEPPKRFDEE